MHWPSTRTHSACLRHRHASTFESSAGPRWTPEPQIDCGRAGAQHQRDVLSVCSLLALFPRSQSPALALIEAITLSRRPLKYPGIIHTGRGLNWASWLVYRRNLVVVGVIVIAVWRAAAMPAPRQQQGWLMTHELILLLFALAAAAVLLVVGPRRSSIWWRLAAADPDRRRAIMGQHLLVALCLRAPQADTLGSQSIFYSNIEPRDSDLRRPDTHSNSSATPRPVPGESGAGNLGPPKVSCVTSDAEASGRPGRRR